MKTSSDVLFAYMMNMLKHSNVTMLDEIMKTEKV